ncbi:DUF6198 family protein [Clostridiaceae bacterium M8S5]|nr:DUF6198 family protein [Clostridiaceae bacterium M8S5]
MKRIKLNKYISYILGLILLSFGIVLAAKSNYGITVSTSPSYVVSLKTDIVSFGTFNYLIQGVVLILMIAVLREFRVIFLLSFLTSILLGYSIDLFTYLLNDFVAISHMIRICCFIFSILIVGLGLVFFIKSKQPILPFDMFVREVSNKYNIGIGKFKTCFDLCILLTSVVLSIVFFRELRGVNIGTLVSAVTIGATVDMFMKLFNKYVEIDEVCE